MAAPRSAANGVKHRAPVFPPGPDLTDRVTLGPVPTVLEYKIAYRAWSLPTKRWDDGSPPQLSTSPKISGQDESDSQRASRLALLGMESMVSGDFE
jgi:hypothetical protein